MALISCPECGNKCSDQAEFCPKCGYPFKNNHDSTTQSKESSDDDYMYTTIKKVAQNIAALNDEIQGYINSGWEYVDVQQHEYGIGFLGIYVYTVTLRKPKIHK